MTGNKVTGKIGEVMPEEVKEVMRKLLDLRAKANHIGEKTMYWACEKAQQAIFEEYGKDPVQSGEIFTLALGTSVDILKGLPKLASESLFKSIAMQLAHEKDYAPVEFDLVTAEAAKPVIKKAMESIPEGATFLMITGRFRKLVEKEPVTGAWFYTHTPFKAEWKYEKFELARKG